MNWITSHLDQITGVVVVAILLSVGRSKILPGVKTKPVLMWLAFVVTAACGLILGWALVDLIAWLTGLHGSGAVYGSIGALIAFTLGWHGVYLLVPLIRDVADGRPDEDARRAALLVPTFLPAGWAGVWGVVTHPTGIGTGIVAAIMAGVTMVYVHLILSHALKAKKAATAWKWFAAGVCLLSGLVAIPLVLYLDGVQARHLPGPWLIAARVVEGTFGVALLIPAIKDITDKIPDRYIRAFLRFGMPLCVAFGWLAITTIFGHASNGGQILTGGMR